jgi:hypothetical protein
MLTMLETGPAEDPTHCAPIVWFSKGQNTVEKSSFGSEFIATCITLELVEALCYKLCMFGIPIKGAASMYFDNGGVVVTTKLLHERKSITPLPITMYMKQLQMAPFILPNRMERPI